MSVFEFPHCDRTVIWWFFFYWRRPVVFQFSQ